VYELCTSSNVEILFIGTKKYIFFKKYCIFPLVMQNVAYLKGALFKFKLVCKYTW